MRVALLLTLRDKLVAKLFSIFGYTNIQSTQTSAIPVAEEREGLKIADTDSRLSAEIDTGIMDSRIFSVHDRVMILESLSDPGKNDMPIIKDEESSKDNVVLGSTKETFGFIGMRASILNDEKRTRPIKFEYISTECIPVDHTLGTDMSMWVTLSAALVVLNEMKYCSSNNTATSELLTAYSHLIETDMTEFFCKLMT